MASAMEPDPSTDTQKSSVPVPAGDNAHLAAPPPLPPRLLALSPVVYVGTAGWLLACLVLLVLRYGFDVGPPIWLWTALAGSVLGILGLPIIWWQRTASRRGARGAQRDL